MTLSHVSLYNKYRPTKFADLIGQDLISTILINSITQHRTVQSYIFSGPRGTGKTTTARLLAKALNCLNFDQDVCNQCVNCVGINTKTTTNILEIDAASNNGIDHVRDLIHNASYLPTGDYLKKVYIIDEAHMLTTNAWNGLLKLVEEPPMHVVIIFSTTEFDKIIATIRSRCQKHHFSLLDLAQLSNHLIQVAQQENYQLEPAAAHKLATLACGSVRDGLTLLEQMMLYCRDQITYQDVLSTLQLVDNATKIRLLNAVFNNNAVGGMELITQLYYQGVSLSGLVQDLVEVLLDLLVYRQTNSIDHCQVLGPDEVHQFHTIPFNLIEQITVWNQLSLDLKQAKNPLLLCKVVVTQLSVPQQEMGGVDSGCVVVSKSTTPTPKRSVPKQSQAQVTTTTKLGAAIELGGEPNWDSNPLPPYVHDPTLFSTKCVYVSDPTLNQALKNKQDKWQQINVVQPPKTTTPISTPIQSSTSGFDLEDNLINYTLKHAKKELTKQLLVKLKALACIEHELKTYFVKINWEKKVPILVSDHTVLVMFDDLNDAYDFNECVEDKKVMVALNQYFKTHHYWVASTSQAVSFRKNKLDQFQIIAVPRFDLQSFEKGSVIQTIIDTLESDA